jgi:hypothetical protein
MLKLDLSGAVAKTIQKSTRGSGTDPVMLCVYQPLLVVIESGSDKDVRSNMLTSFMLTV